MSKHKKIVRKWNNYDNYLQAPYESVELTVTNSEGKIVTLSTNEAAIKGVSGQVRLVGLRNEKGTSIRIVKVPAKEGEKQGAVFDSEVISKAEHAGKKILKKKQNLNFKASAVI